MQFCLIKLHFFICINYLVDVFNFMYYYIYALNPNNVIVSTIAIINMPKIGLFSFNLVEYLVAIAPQL